MNNIPNKFEISIGGYLGNSFSVLMVKDGKLEYRSSDYGSANWKKIIINPTIEMWTAFRCSLDSIKIWRWKERYSNADIVDGTSWGISIQYDDIIIHTSGSDNYPKNGFEQFLKAVQTLVGGREFS